MASFWRVLRTRSGQQRIIDTLSILVLLLGACIIMVPFFWMLSTALKQNSDVFLVPPQWIPSNPKWSTFAEAFAQLKLNVYAFNTFFIVSAVMVGTLFSASFAAYGFARLQAPGRDTIFLLLLATMMLPGAVTLVPTYLMFNTIGWINTYLPLIVPSFFGSAYFVFLMRQFYITIPRELEESAMMDGASVYRIWWSIMLPLSGPVLATIAVFTFVGTYNDFFNPLIYLNDESKRTIAVALSYLSGSPRSVAKMNLMMAAVTISIIPPILLFIAAQRYFVRGIVTTGLKG
jgi:multiple sugar transport system permease protein/sn-glycerol 3-phosphate transport system permease protein